MRKQFYILILLSFCATCVIGQSAFVLVDVSGSGPKPAIRDEAKNIVKDLIQGKFDQTVYKNWKWTYQEGVISQIVAGTGSPLIAKDNFLIMMPFGSKNRYRRHKITAIQDFPNDVITGYDKYYPKRFTDGRTHRDLANAMTASIAAKKQINTYYLIEVSDFLNDVKSTNGYTAKEQAALAAYGSSTVKSIKLGTLFCEESGAKNYQIQIRKVAVSNIPQNPNPGVNPAQSGLQLVRPKGTKRKPAVIESSNLTVSWRCLGCPPNTAYRVTLKHLTDRKNTLRQKVQGSSYTFKDLKAGIYRVTVAGNNSSKTGYAEIKNSSSILPIILFLALLGGGYYIWNNYIRGRANPSNNNNNRNNSNRGNDRSGSNNDFNDFT